VSVGLAAFFAKANDQQGGRGKPFPAKAFRLAAACRRAGLREARRYKLIVAKKKSVLDCEAS